MSEKFYWPKVGDIVRHVDEEIYQEVGPMKLIEINFAETEYGNGPYLCQWQDGDKWDYFGSDIEKCDEAFYMTEDF